MTPRRKKNTGRKTIRSVKRARYVKAFEHRYGMTRGEWRDLKKSNPSIAQAKRERAIMY